MIKLLPIVAIYMYASECTCVRAYVLFEQMWHCLVMQCPYVRLEVSNIECEAMNEPFKHINSYNNLLK